MLEGLFSTDRFDLAKQRRIDLVKQIKREFPTKKMGVVLAIGSFEKPEQRFLQDSSFYYLSGITDPGIVLTIDVRTGSTVFVPSYNYNRAAWLASCIDHEQTKVHAVKVEQICKMGIEPVSSKGLSPLATKEQVSYLLESLAAVVHQEGTVFVANASGHGGLEQQVFLRRLCSFVPGLDNLIVDVSPLVAQGRRTKHVAEIQLLDRAVRIGEMAQEMAAATIAPGEQEAVVQASLEWIITGSVAIPSFPSIVAGGLNGTVLHYHSNDNELNAGDLVVVDIGARVEGYCSDITRTYPVNGRFSNRQKELYNIVLEVQEYIAGITAPGFWLSNADKPDQSLNHLTRKAFARYGLDKYFIHSVSHFLGLDVHDVGDVRIPLAVGDVFTIEPGLYLPEEGIGIRIEDDYWIAGTGAVCLSDGLAKTVEGVEELMEQARREKG